MVVVLVSNYTYVYKTVETVNKAGKGFHTLIEPNKVSWVELRKSKLIFAR